MSLKLCFDESDDSELTTDPGEEETPAAGVRVMALDVVFFVSLPSVPAGLLVWENLQLSPFRQPEAEKKNAQGGLLPGSEDAAEKSLYFLLEPVMVLWLIARSNRFVVWKRSMVKR